MEPNPVLDTDLRSSVFICGSFGDLASISQLKFQRRAIDCVELTGVEWQWSGRLPAELARAQERS